MQKFIFFAILLAGTQAQAIRMPATHFGLTPETGYLEAVTQDEVCGYHTNVLISYNHLGQPLITKCNGAIIGWIERTVTAPDLGVDDLSYDDYDMLIKTGTVDQYGNDSINIYTCGDERPELLDYPDMIPARNPILTFEGLMSLREQGKTMSVQLFFNEFAYSGKCIGRFMEKI